jgi:uncharacterized protein (DUF2147 family)
MKTSLLLAFILLIATPSTAQDVTGTWQTVDDKTGEVKSVIEIYKSKGKIYGKVLKVLVLDAPDSSTCQDCDGRFKGKPIIGLEIMWDFEKRGKYYKNGFILDPETGKQYNCKIWLNTEDSNRLNVRGYVLFLYRTQEWIRLK